MLIGVTKPKKKKIKKKKEEFKVSKVLFKKNQSGDHRHQKSRTVSFGLAPEIDKSIKRIIIPMYKNCNEIDIG